MSGDLDALSVPEFRARLRLTLETHRPGRVEVDLAGVGFLDCAGARSLLWADACVREWGGGVVFVRPAPLVLRLLRLLGFDAVLSVRVASPVVPPVVPPVPRPQPTAEAGPRPG
nr:STAS domain-containing protein [Microbispora sp. H11081]